MTTFKKSTISKLLIINEIFFPFIAIVSAVLLIVESFTYPGFIQNHILLSPELLFILFVISSYFVVARKDGTGNYKYLDFLSRLLLLFFPALAIVGYIFLSLEGAHYRGYVYTHGFHFDPIYFYYLFSICLLIFVVSVVRSKRLIGIINPSNAARSYLSLISFLIFIVMMLSNLRIDLLDAKPRLAAVVKHPFADSVWKGRYLFGNFYDYMMFINKYTPPNATIMRMAQQSEWPALSNDGYDRRFIYPRYTKAGDQNSLNDSAISYVFIAAIDKWPTFPVKAKEIIYMRDNDYTKPPIILYKDYDPDDHTYDNLWGLIVLNH